MSAEKPDMVRLPPHYVVGQYECIEVAQALGFWEDALLFSAFKYLWRATRKGDLITDLNKCKFFLELRILKEQKQRTEEKEKTYAE